MHLSNLMTPITPQKLQVNWLFLFAVLRSLYFPGVGQPIKLWMRSLHENKQSSAEKQSEQGENGCTLLKEEEKKRGKGNLQCARSHLESHAINLLESRLSVMQHKHVGVWTRPMQREELWGSGRPHVSVFTFLDESFCIPQTHACVTQHMPLALKSAWTCAHDPSHFNTKRTRHARNSGSSVPLRPLLTLV